MAKTKARKIPQKEETIMIKRKIIFSFIATIFLFAYSSEVWAKHFFMMLHYDKGKISVVKKKSKIKREDVAPIDKAHIAANNKIYKCNILDKRGVVLYSSFAKIPRVIYGDWLDENGELTGTAVPIEETAFRVRMPHVDGADIIKIVSKEAGSQTETFTEELSINVKDFKDESKAHRIPFEHTIDKCVIVVVAEGYTASEEIKFGDDFDDIILGLPSDKEGFAEVSPFAENDDVMEYHKLFEPSDESGADDPSEGHYVDTAFDATYDSYGIGRLLTVDDTKVFDFVDDHIPNFDYIFVMVNDEQYGGSGGSVTTFSIHEAAAEICAHEAGHLMGKLADEYETPYPGGYPPGDWEPNVTFELNVDSVPNEYGWRDLIYRDWPDGLWECDDPWTPPCPTPDFNYTKYGLFEGARYLSEGIYRPKHTCKMRSLNQPFCDVCKNAIQEAIDEKSTPNNPPQPPSITFTPSEVHLGDTVRVQASSTDPDLCSVSYEWVVLGGPVLWQGTPDDDTNFGPLTTVCTYTFYCTARDEHGMPSPTSSKDLLTVGNHFIDVTSPVGGDWPKGSLMDIEWNSSELGDNVKIELDRPFGCDNRTQDYIAVVSYSTNSYEWPVDVNEILPLDNCKIRICSVNYPEICDESGSFRIVAPTNTTTTTIPVTTTSSTSSSTSSSSSTTTSINPPKLCVSESSFSFQYTECGSTPGNEYFYIANCGGQGAINYNVNGSKIWIDVSPHVGWCTTEADKITVGVCNLSTMAPGTYEGTIYVTSAYGNKNISVTLTINENQSPDWDNVQIYHEVDECEELFCGLSYQVPEATDPEGDYPITYECYDKPPLSTFNALNRNFKWKPPYTAVDPGDGYKYYFVYLRATDTCDKSTNSGIGIKVIDVPRAPSVTALVDITSFPGLFMNEGESVTINANATDPDDNDTIWYKWYVAIKSGGEWYEWSIYDWSTSRSSITVELSDHGFRIKWRCEVKDKTGLTDENYTSAWWVYP